MNAELLVRIEDASLNASAPPQQRWLDGWLVRLSPGKAKRARCIHAVAAGLRPLQAKLNECEALYREARLPLVFRLTPFTQPASLDAELAAMGYLREDDTSVMVCADLGEAARRAAARLLPAGMSLCDMSLADYAAAVGRFRGTPTPAVESHAQRLLLSPVPYLAMACFDKQGRLLAGGQSARESDVVGLYDVFTLPEARGCGLASALCGALLAKAAAAGASTAYLQVEDGNASAWSVYQHLGFVRSYGYHYRVHPTLGH